MGLGAGGEFRSNAARAGFAPKLLFYPDFRSSFSPLGARRKMSLGADTPIIRKYYRKLSSLGKM